MRDGLCRPGCTLLRTVTKHSVNGPDSKLKCNHPRWRSLYVCAKFFCSKLAFWM